MIYKITEFDGPITDEITEFLLNATQRGFTNNSTIEQLYSFKDERRHVLFFIWHKDKIIGSFGAHSIDIIPNSYRIITRMCILTDKSHYTGLRTLNGLIKQHQSLVTRIAMPWCINWVNDPDSNLFISSHESSVGTQRIVHNLYCPTLSDIGVVEKYGDYQYRGHVQTFWRMNVDVLLEQLKETDKGDITIIN